MFIHRGWIRLAVAAGAFVLLATACGSDEPYTPAGIIRTPTPDVSGLSLPAVSHGSDLQFIADPDEYLLIYFGYTACPDVCPTTLADVRKALRNMGDDLAARVDVAMITVDPERDTDEIITAYIQAFVPDGYGLRTLDADLLAEVAEPFGAKYGVEVLEDGWVDVIHTAFLYAVDDEGLIQITWPFGMESEMIEADLRALLNGDFPHE